LEAVKDLFQDFFHRIRELPRKAAEWECAYMCDVSLELIPGSLFPLDTILYDEFFLTSLTCLVEPTITFTKENYQQFLSTYLQSEPNPIQQLSMIEYIINVVDSFADDDSDDDIDDDNLLSLNTFLASRAKLEVDATSVWYIYLFAEEPELCKKLGLTIEDYCLFLGNSRNFKSEPQAEFRFLQKFITSLQFEPELNKQLSDGNTVITHMINALRITPNNLNILSFVTPLLLLQFVYSDHKDLIPQFAPFKEEIMQNLSTLLEQDKHHTDSIVAAMQLLSKLGKEPEKDEDRRERYAQEMARMAAEKEEEDRLEEYGRELDAEQERARSFGMK
jgi:hypothetical protein